MHCRDHLYSSNSFNITYVCYVERKTMEYLLALIIAVILIFIIVFIWVGSIMYQDPNLNPYENPSDPPTRQCLAGQCAVNKYSGVKRCPANNKDIINARLDLEVCSSKYICDNPIQPIAIDSRGVALNDNNCPTNTVCQCLAGQYCGPDIMVYFKPYWNQLNYTTKYTQLNTVKDSLGNTISLPPYYIPPGQGECTITPTLYATRSLDTATCLFGTMAYYPEANTLVDGLVTPLACVRGKPCTLPGETAVYNPSTRGIDCVNIQDSVIPVPI